MTAHLSDYFDAKEIECEPPKGNFNCVAKCGLSGVLLGPPNIHEFNATVREMIRTRYPSMSESEYRSHIEMVRDSEAIEEWRKGATKKTVFTAKGAGEGAPTLTREQAEQQRIREENRARRERARYEDDDDDSFISKEQFRNLRPLLDVPM